jgi:alpha-tubulin suppressor-like RCC1 family protein
MGLRAKRAALLVGLVLGVLLALGPACVSTDPPSTTVPNATGCPAALVDCGGDCIDDTFHPSHCGGCGNACEDDLVCSLGICATQCLGGSKRCGDRCVDTLLDPQHCGDCGTECPPGQVCSGAKCGLDCVGGTNKCGGKCVDAEVDPNHCGDCDQPCEAALVCSGGLCGVECKGGTKKCGAKCVDTSLDPGHCGDCGVVCGVGEVCSQGICALQCVGGTTECTGKCVDTKLDALNCGGCGQLCPAGEVCSNGTCGLECVGGTTKCGGKCVDLETDPAHCGGCGMTCPAGEVCSAEKCALSCVGGTTKCGGKCLDLQSDSSNCGVCGKTCLPGEVCSSGGCAISCGGGATQCGTKCVDTQIDTAHCGMCNKACPPGEGCSAGACGLECVGGTTRCGSKCSDTGLDPSHCGMCGNVCPGAANATAICLGGGCDIVCKTGFADCNVTEGDGCEIDTQTSSSHCGGCGKPCNLANATPSCTAGTCTVGSCNAGFGNCDNNDANGCETNLSGDNNHCGMCGKVCGMGESCIGGACVACASQVALGAYHTCARKVDGSLWCWGLNDSGQLGDGTTVNKSSPAQVTALGTTVAEVALGERHTCARKTDGTLWCWGYNIFGQLGDGSTTNRSSPVQVTALGTTVAEVALRGLHSCARKTDDSLWCWGYNIYGQLGDGTTTDRSTPVAVTTLGATVAEVALGSRHTCARRTDATLWCWGRNAYGELGDGTTTNRSTPVEVTVLGTTVAEVALAGHHSCARKNDATLWCWGQNASGQVGDGTTVQKNSPVEVTALGATVALPAAGEDHTCARKTDATLWCWGYNFYGQLGDGTTTNKSTPVEVTALGTTVADAALGSTHSCARKTDGQLSCWGYNAYGQLGDGTTTSKATPTAIACPGGA